MPLVRTCMYEVWCGIVLGIFTRGVMLGAPSEEL